MRRLAVSLLLLAVAFVVPGIAQGAQGVKLEGSQFVPRDLAIPRGETVTWTNMDGMDHSVVAEDGSFNSHPACGAIGGACMKRGESFSHTFTQPGRVAYYCRIHGAPGGGGMAGTVAVS
jgi:plastocyanin